MRSRRRKKNADPTIDLHGVKHAQVESMVEEFVLLNKMPVRIITGHSEKMKSIVRMVLERHHFQYMECLGNSGMILVIS